MTIEPYPYPLPAKVVKLRSALQSAAAVTASLRFRIGMFYTFEVFGRDDKLVYKSDLVSDHIRLFRPAYLRAIRLPGPFRCRITYTYYNGSPFPVVWSHAANVDVKAVRPGTFITLRKTRNTLNSLRNQRAPRRLLSKRPARPFASNLRASPEVHTSTVPHMVVTNGVLTTDTVDTYESFNRTWSGVRTPHFGKLKRSRLPVNDHHSLTERTYDLGLEVTHIDKNSGPPGPFDPDFIIEISSWSSKLGTAVAGGAPSAPTHDGLARNKAIRKLVDSIGSGLDANLAQDFVQFRQTAKTISDSVSKIASSLIALKKGDLIGATKFLWGSHPSKFRKSRPLKPGAPLADNWLAMQYGWKPLLNDIDGVCKSLANYFQSNSLVRSARSASTVTTVENIADLTRNTSPFLVIGDHMRRRSTTCKFVVHYQVDSALQSFLAQTGFTNPVNLLWEVLPFSFVADWFLPIGPYLETLSSFDGLQFVDGCQTQFTRVNIYRSLNYSGTPNFPWYYEEYFGGFQRESVLLDRNRLLAFPNLTFPEFKSPFDSHNQHILNGLALIRAVTR